MTMYRYAIKAGTLFWRGSVLLLTETWFWTMSVVSRNNGEYCRVALEVLVTNFWFHSPCQWLYYNDFLMLLFFLFGSPKIDCKVGCSLATISILCQNMLLFSIHIVFKFKLCRLVRVWEDQRHLTTSPPILHIKLSPVHQFSSTVPDLEIQTSQTVNHQKPLHATSRSHPSEVKVNAAARHTPSVCGRSGVASNGDITSHNGRSSSLSCGTRGTLGENWFLGLFCCMLGTPGRPRPRPRPRLLPLPFPLPFHEEVALVRRSVMELWRLRLPLLRPSVRECWGYKFSGRWSSMKEPEEPGKWQDLTQQSSTTCIGGFIRWYCKYLVWL